MGDHGTLYQLRNKLNRTNVIEKPKNDVNACEDFLETITSGLIVTSALTTLKLASTDDTPGTDVLPEAESVWIMPDNERSECLKRLCGQVYDRFIGLQYNNSDQSPQIADPKDGVCQYSVQLLRLGCFYLEYSDAIREGDGGRVLRCWKYLLPIFAAAGNRNYACEAANLLVQHFYTLSPRLSAQLIWSRFINVHGRPGKNIAGDLHMEHLNKIAKEAILFQGANKTTKAMLRIGHTIGTLSPVLDQFDAQNKVSSTNSIHARPDSRNDVHTVVNELIKSHSFTMEKGRKHKQFPNPKNLLKTKDKEELLAWLITKLPRSF